MASRVTKDVDVQNMVPNKLVSLNLYRARLEKGWTQEEVGQAFGRHPLFEKRGGYGKASVNAWEKGWREAATRRHSVGVNMLCAAADVFGKPLCWFLDRPTPKDLLELDRMAKVGRKKKVSLHAEEYRQLVEDSERLRELEQLDRAWEVPSASQERYETNQA